LGMGGPMIVMFVLNGIHCRAVGSGRFTSIIGGNEADKKG